MRLLSPMIVLFALMSQTATAQAPDTSTARAEIETFNRALDSATRAMNNAAVLALWEDDGVSLLPQTKPIVGKPAIRAFVEEVTSRFPDARMESFTLACSGIEISGPWASEWCEEHQVVKLPTTRFDGRGHMLLVLHRGADGRWRIRREMWNQAPSPDLPAR
jgi:ketosteroid isomerase-like protein